MLDHRGSDTHEDEMTHRDGQGGLRGQSDYVSLSLYLQESDTRLRPDVFDTPDVGKSRSTDDG